MRKMSKIDPNIDENETKYKKKIKMSEILKKRPNIRLILPFRLPTWNQLLAMNRWERKKVRDWIKNAVYMCIHEGDVWPTQEALVLKLSSTDWSLQEYYQTITPNSLKNLRLRKKLQKMTKP